MSESELLQLLADWGLLNTKLSTLTINELKMLINYECSTKRRHTYIERIHQRYGKLVNAEERQQMLNGGLL